jgi:Tfp pilus assembly protein PilO
MNRQVALIAGLAAMLVVVAFYMFGWRTQSERIAEIEEQIAAVEQEQTVLQQRIVRLQDVRARAPEFEAQIVVAESIVPRELALPSALRQLQTAADDAAIELISITPGRPTTVGEGGLAPVPVAVQVTGSYFQVIDFLRRIEDPTITPRGVTWTQIALSPSDHPTLSASISGTMYAVVGEAPGPVTRQVEPDEPATDVEEGEG